MEEKSRIGYGIKYKIALFVVAAIAIWEVIQNDTTSNVLVNLFFGGIVPGTNMTLSPDTVIYIVTGVAIVGVLLVVLRQSILHIRHRSPKVIIGLAETAEPTADTFETTAPFMPEPVVQATLELAPAHDWTEIVLPAQPKIRKNFVIIAARIMAASLLSVVALTSYSAHWFYLQVKRLGRFMAVAMQSVVHTLAAIGIALSHWAQWSARAAAGLLRNLYALLALLFRISLLAGRASVRTTTQASKQLWQWSRPYLQYFDRWLQSQFSHTAAKLEEEIRRRDTLNFMLHVGSHATSSLPDVKPLTKRTRQVFHRYAGSDSPRISK